MKVLMIKKVAGAFALKDLEVDRNLMGPKERQGNQTFRRYGEKLKVKTLKRLTIVHIKYISQD